MQITTLSNNYSPIKKIYHLSDIHIRLDKRHNEYKLVFEKLYAYIKSQDNENSLIIIAGDILHSKTELSPEAVSLTSSFFMNLASICDCIVLIGNHDFNAYNTNRLDSLSPIINNLHSPKKIHYLLNSGFYQYKNLLFGVSSLFDNKFIHMNDIDKNIDITNLIKISLYHGIVHDAFNDLNFKLSSNINSKEFVDYDYVLLGDVHKKQIINNNIFYPGSLIQQNFGEDINNHGLFVHDLILKTSEYININNDFGYVTLDVIDGKINNYNLPKFPRLKLKLYNTTPEQYSSICTDLKSKYSVQEITFVNTFEKVVKNNIIIEETKHDDYTNLNIQNEIITNYLKNENVDDILNFNKLVYNDIKKVDIARNKWIIKKLSFKNMFCYGSDNAIVFENISKNTILGLCGQNYTGKSSVLDIILFALFDKCSRGSRTDVLNEKKKTFWCQIEFDIGGDEYIIKREGFRNNKNKSESVKITVNFGRKTKMIIKV